MSEPRESNAALAVMEEAEKRARREALIQKQQPIITSLKLREYHPIAESLRVESIVKLGATPETSFDPSLEDHLFVFKWIHVTTTGVRQPLPTASPAAVTYELGPVKEKDAGTYLCLQKRAVRAADVLNSDDEYDDDDENGWSLRLQVHLSIGPLVRDVVVKKDVSELHLPNLDEEKAGKEIRWLYYGPRTKDALDTGLQKLEASIRGFSEARKDVPRRFSTVFESWQRTLANALINASKFGSRAFTVDDLAGKRWVKRKLSLLGNSELSDAIMEQYKQLKASTVPLDIEAVQNLLKENYTKRLSSTQNLVTSQAVKLWSLLIEWLAVRGASISDGSLSFTGLRNADNADFFQWVATQGITIPSFKDDAIETLISEANSAAKSFAQKAKLAHFEAMASGGLAAMIREGWEVPVSEDGERSKKIKLQEYAFKRAQLAASLAHGLAQTVLQRELLHAGYSSHEIEEFAAAPNDENDIDFPFLIFLGRLKQLLTSEEQQNEDILGITRRLLFRRIFKSWNELFKYVCGAGELKNSKAFIQTVMAEYHSGVQLVGRKSELVLRAEQLNAGGGLYVAQTRELGGWKSSTMYYVLKPLQPPETINVDPMSRLLLRTADAVVDYEDGISIDWQRGSAHFHKDASLPKYRNEIEVNESCMPVVPFFFDAGDSFSGSVHIDAKGTYRSYLLQQLKSVKAVLKVKQEAVTTQKPEPICEYFDSTAGDGLRIVRAALLSEHEVHASPFVQKISLDTHGNTLLSLTAYEGYTNCLAGAERNIASIAWYHSRRDSGTKALPRFDGRMKVSVNDDGEGSAQGTYTAILLYKAEKKEEGQQQNDIGDRIKLADEDEVGPTGDRNIAYAFQFSVKVNTIDIRTGVPFDPEQNAFGVARWHNQPSEAEIEERLRVPMNFHSFMKTQEQRLRQHLDQFFGERVSLRDIPLYVLVNVNGFDSSSTGETARKWASQVRRRLGTLENLMRRVGYNEYDKAEVQEKWDQLYASPRGVVLRAMIEDPNANLRLALRKEQQAKGVPENELIQVHPQQNQMDVLINTLNEEKRLRLLFSHYEVNKDQGTIILYRNKKSEEENIDPTFEFQNLTFNTPSADPSVIPQKARGSLRRRETTDNPEALRASRERRRKQMIGNMFNEVAEDDSSRKEKLQLHELGTILSARFPGVDFLIDDEDGDTAMLFIPDGTQDISSIELFPPGYDPTQSDAFVGTCANDDYKKLAQIMSADELPIPWLVQCVGSGEVVCGYNRPCGIVPVSIRNELGYKLSNDEMKMLEHFFEEDLGEKKEFRNNYGEIVGSYIESNSGYSRFSTRFVRTRKHGIVGKLRDPVHDHGLTRQFIGADWCLGMSRYSAFGDCIHEYVQWNCCGLPPGHPGCWIGRHSASTRGQIEYDALHGFSPTVSKYDIEMLMASKTVPAASQEAVQAFIGDEFASQKIPAASAAVLMRIADDVKQQFLQSGRRGSAWLDQARYDRIHQKIQSEKRAIADDVGRYYALRAEAERQGDETVESLDPGLVERIEAGMRRVFDLQGQYNQVIKRGLPAPAPEIIKRRIEDILSIDLDESDRRVEAVKVRRKSEKAFAESVSKGTFEEPLKQFAPQGVDTSALQKELREARSVLNDMSSKQKEFQAKLNELERDISQAASLEKVEFSIANRPEAKSALAKFDSALESAQKIYTESITALRELQSLQIDLERRIASIATEIQKENADMGAITSRLDGISESASDKIAEVNGLLGQIDKPLGNLINAISEARTAISSAKEAQKREEEERLRRQAGEKEQQERLERQKKMREDVEKRIIEEEESKREEEAKRKNEEEERKRRAREKIERIKQNKAIKLAELKEQAKDVANIVDDEQRRKEEERIQRETEEAERKRIEAEEQLQKEEEERLKQQREEEQRRKEKEEELRKKNEEELRRISEEEQESKEEQERLKRQREEEEEQLEDERRRQLEAFNQVKENVETQLTSVREKIRESAVNREELKQKTFGIDDSVVKQRVGELFNSSL